MPAETSQPILRRTNTHHENTTRIITLFSAPGCQTTYILLLSFAIKPSATRESGVLYFAWCGVGRRSPNNVCKMHRGWVRPCRWAAVRPNPYLSLHKRRPAPHISSSAEPVRSHAASYTRAAWRLFRFMGPAQLLEVLAVLITFELTSTRTRFSAQA